MHVAAADVDLVGEGDGDRLAGDRLVEVAVLGDDALDVRLAPGGHDPDQVAGAHRAADDLAGEAAEVEVGPVHPLHRHAERRGLRVVVDLDRLEVADERRPVVPGRVRPTAR